ncbi:DUF7617 domain-containing protein [Allocatelliglobosispora scoriae]
MVNASVSADAHSAYAASVLTKSAQNTTHPGASPASHGDVINWVLSYADSGARGVASITDQIAGAPGSQSYVPGSLRTPQGWVPNWSTDGTTFGATEPATGTVAVRATNPDAHPGGTNLARLLLPPVQTQPTPTGGDGFTAYVYRGPDGEVEAWNTYHHLYHAAPKVVCTNLLTNSPCAGGPWPRPLNTAVGPLGAGFTGDIQSTLAPQYVTDPAYPGKLFYAAVTTTSVGVGCLDMPNRANCGYVPLTAFGGSPSAVNGMAGFVAVDGKMYGVDTTGKVLCLTIASLTPCAGQPYTAVVPGNNDNPGGANYLGSLTLAGGKVFASSSPSGGPVRLGCFDPATTAACTGWATPKTVGPAGSYSYAAFTSYGTDGSERGACAPVVTGGPPVVGCFAIDGTPIAAPGGFGSVANGALTFNPETVTAPNGHLQSYFPFWGGSLAGGTGCWDWTASAVCAGFPFPKTHPNVNGGATRDYGYDYDETTECLVALGDAGVLFSVDPATGGSPCVRSGASVNLTPGAFYCDGGTSHVQAYRDAKLENITLTNVDLGNSTATVTDPGGTVIATPAFAPDGSLDLSGISVAANPAIVVNARLVLLSTADFTGGNQPNIVVSYQGDAPQLCFKTKLSSACSVTSVTNTASGTDPAGAFTSNTVTVPIAPGTECQPVVTVNKEICQDTRASRCGPGGPGPWAKTTPVGLLGLLGTAYWRITVTNSGGVAAAGVTINDQVVPGCVSAGGTFTLAPGASKQVFCSTFLVLLPLTNTASATFTAAGAPPNTPPTTTAPSSATACSLLCILGNPNDQSAGRAPVRTAL